MNHSATTATAPSTRNDQRNGVTVMIGAATAVTGQTTDIWSTPDTPTHAYEAFYVPARISLADAEASIRTQLAEYGVHVTAFVNEDSPLTPGAAGHYPWCTPGQCIDHRYDDGEVLVEHVGPSARLPIPDGMDATHGELLQAELYADENYDDTPRVSFNSGGNGVPLDADELDTVIGHLAGFLGQLRTMRRQMGEARA